MNILEHWLSLINLWVRLCVYLCVHVQVCVVCVSVQSTKYCSEFESVFSPTDESLGPPESQVAPRSTSATRPPSLLHLPPEVLLIVLRHLSPPDLLRTSQTNSALHRLTFEPSLWVHLHPVRWACGHWQFFSPLEFTLGGCVSGEEVTAVHDAVLENDAVKELMSVEGSVNANLRGKKLVYLPLLFDGKKKSLISHHVTLWHVVLLCTYVCSFQR